MPLVIILSSLPIGGLGLPIVFGTGQVITGICSGKIRNDYDASIERIIAAVDHRSEKSKQIALKVINKKQTYETTLNSLKWSGIEENQAIFYTVCGMITGMVEVN